MDGQTDWRTDRPTDGWTDPLIEIRSWRTHLKTRKNVFPDEIWLRKREFFFSRNDILKNSRRNFLLGTECVWQSGTRDQKRDKSKRGKRNEAHKRKYTTRKRRLAQHIFVYCFSRQIVIKIGRVNSFWTLSYVSVRPKANGLLSRKLIFLVKSESRAGGQG